MGLFLDLSRACTGYAVMIGDKHVLDYGVWKYEHLTHGQMLSQLYADMNDTLELADFDMIGYENAAFQRGIASELFHNMAGVVKMLGAEHGLKVLKANASTIKYVTAGSGKAPKADVIQAINRRLGLNLTDDNIADALGVGLVAFSNAKMERSAWA